MDPERWPRDLAPRPAILFWLLIIGEEPAERIWSAYLRGPYVLGQPNRTRVLEV